MNIMTGGRKSLPKVNVPGVINRMDPFTSDGTPKDPDMPEALRSILEFILSKPVDRRHAPITESLTIMAGGTIYINGLQLAFASMGKYEANMAALQVDLRQWWDDRGMINDGPYAPRAFQVMLDDTIGYMEGSTRVIIKDFLR